MSKTKFVICNLKFVIPARRAGFTLAELMIVVMIVGFLGTLSFRTYLDLVRRQELDNALNQTVEIIKTVRNYAVTSYTVYSGNPPITPTIPAEGYGIYLTTTPEDEGPHITAFANVSATNEKADQFDPDDLTLESYKFPASVVFDKLFKLEPGESSGTPDTGADAGTETVIIFRPPFAETTISNNGDLADENNRIDTLSIQLFQKDEPNRKKVITIDKVSGTAALHL